MAVVSGGSKNTSNKYTDIKLASFDDYIRYIRESISKMTPNANIE